jgi:hypothetical protein
MVLFAALLGCQPAPLDATGTTTTSTFTSAIVEDDYVLRLRLPPNHDPDTPYPLIVQLDPTFVGLKQFDHTVGFVSQRAADGDWPEAIVLGVDYPDPYTRSRDYTPDDTPDPAFNDAGADTFYRVLRDELLPHVEADLAVSRRLIVGHSNGGVFATYAALRYDPATPPLFSGFVAADFGLDTSMFTYQQWLFDRADDLPIRWYASRAVFNGATQQITHDAFFERLRDAALPGLALQTEVLEADHGGAVAPSFDAGLAFTLAEVP